MMIIGQMHNLHVTGMSTWCCIICTIACNGIWTMIFLIVIVNTEYHIIVLNSVFQISIVSAEYFAVWVSIRVPVALEFVCFTICRLLQLPRTGSRIFDLELHLQLGPHISVDMVKTMFFYNCSTCKQLLMILLCHQSFIVLSGNSI